jgi:cytochrome c
MFRVRSVLSVCVVSMTACTSALAADAPASAGRKIFDSRCASCHVAASPGATTLGPSLVGIIGRKAGTQASGVHSRSVVESGIVWDRKSLARFLSEPGRAAPGTVMPVSVTDSKELDALLDYLETLR